MNSLNSLHAIMRNMNRMRTSLDDFRKMDLKDLTIREQEVLKLRFGIDDRNIRTFEEVAILMGVTRERIRQVEAKAFEKLVEGMSTKCDSCGCTKDSPCKTEYGTCYWSKRNYCSKCKE